MKKYILLAVISLCSGLLNFLLFIYSYNRLATPYLLEEQRVENADFIMSFTLGGYILITVLSTVIIYSFASRMGK